jgi:hypothetical protein
MTSNKLGLIHNYVLNQNCYKRANLNTPRDGFMPGVKSNFLSLKAFPVILCQKMPMT